MGAILIQESREYREGLRQEIRQLDGYADWDDRTRNNDYHRPPIERCIDELHAFRIVFGQEKTAEEWRQYTADSTKREDYASWLEFITVIDEDTWKRWAKTK